MSDETVTTPEFRPWPKIARLNRDIVVTEKIDGTNAAVGVLEDGTVYAQSRSRIITPREDNFGFARWVNENTEALRDLLGPGLHFGEWWGAGIQRGYGLTDKRFSLFNVARYGTIRDSAADVAIYAVPVLYSGPFSQTAIDAALADLAEGGSVAAPGFSRPEGIVVFHTAAGTMYKVTIEGDGEPKSARAAA